MTEILPSNLSQDEMDLQSIAANIDPDELSDSPSASFVIRSPIVSPLVDLTCATHCLDVLQCEDSLQQQQQRHHIARRDQEQVQISVIALLLAALRRTGLTCRPPPDDMKMEIGWPTNVRHVAHVTFDRFNGFLGLPVEFEMEIPRRVPSASASVFGVSAESMQCSYDRKGNSVPTILLLLQERLYDQGGLKAEGVFRINAENSQEEHVRDQLNRGIVPHDIDVHCLAGLIKAWFRELPKGVLDSLSPEQVMQCHTEEESLALVKTLPPSEAALLDWAINLMADVVQDEYFNKMNSHNIAMVFAPNMTQMSDPLTALMHAVQVMNLLKALILKTLREREEAVLDPRPASSCTGPPSGSGRDSANKGPCLGVCDSNDATENGQAMKHDGMLLMAYDDGVTEYVSALDSKEMFSTRLSPRVTSAQDELPTKICQPISDGSGTMDNTDDDSNDLESYTRKIRRGERGSKKLSLSSNADVDGTSIDLCLYGDCQSEFLFNVSGRMENLKLEQEDFDITDFMHCGSVPSKGNLKGGGIFGKIDQLIERVEAW